MKSVRVDWRTKNAKLEFDESQVAAQTISQLIQSTPHMMGGELQYGGWLALKVPALADEETASRVRETLGELEGVKNVKAYLRQKAIGIRFAEDGSLTTQQLVEELEKAGIKASTF